MDIAAAGVGPIGVTQPPASIRLVEYENLYGKQSRTGSMTPSVPKQLAWFAVYNVPDYGPISLPAGLPSTAYDRPKHPIGTCELFSAISATTGQTLDGFQYCGPGS